MCLGERIKYPYVKECHFTSLPETPSSNIKSSRLLCSNWMVVFRLSKVAVQVQCLHHTPPLPVLSLSGLGYHHAFYVCNLLSGNSRHSLHQIFYRMHIVNVVSFNHDDAPFFRRTKLQLQYYMNMVNL